MAEKEKTKKKKKEREVKVVLERTYNIPLRKESQKAPRHKRTPKAVRALKAFIIKHMKAEKVKIGKYLNQELWKHGIKNPPHHIKVVCKRDEENICKAELFGAPEEKKEEVKPKREKKEEKKEEIEIKTKPALTDEDLEEKGAEEKKEVKDKEALEHELEEKVEEAKEEKAEEAKMIEKEEIKELKKMPPPVPKDAKLPHEHGHKIDVHMKAPRGAQKTGG